MYKICAHSSMSKYMPFAIRCTHLVQELVWLQIWTCTYHIDVAHYLQIRISISVCYYVPFDLSDIILRITEYGDFPSLDFLKYT